MAALMAKPRWQTRRITIKDIAKAAEVDPSTVTRALQDSERVRAATRDKIKALAAEMGYVPNIAARTLVNRSSGLVGVVIPDMTNPFFAELARGVKDEAIKHDLRVLISDTHGEEAITKCLQARDQEMQLLKQSVAELQKAILELSQRRFRARSVFQ